MTEDLRIFEIYQIKNNLNNKSYFGKATNTNSCWISHRKKARDGIFSKAIDKALAEIGFQNFTIAIVAKSISLNQADIDLTNFIVANKTNDSNFGYNVDSQGPGMAPSDRKNAIERQQKVKAEKIRRKKFIETSNGRYKLYQPSINQNDDEHKLHYIYKITNLINGKVYIGQTYTLNRWRDHKKHARGNPKQRIDQSMKSHGIENFSFEVIAMCNTKRKTNETERDLIVQYNSRDREIGYNIAVGGA